MNDEVNPADLVRPSTVIDTKVADLPSKWREDARVGVFTCGTGEAYRESLRDCADELESALAASQPVGQEPVCSISPYDLAKLQKHETARVRPPGQGVPLYAAPPAAQAVDLPDDFSESKDWRESNYNGRVDWLKAMHASQRAEIVRLQNDVEILRALIDQQAGKGVRHG